MKEVWTFESRYLGSEWLQTSRRFKTLYEAAYELRSWLVVSAENGILAEGRLKKIKD